jgi:hypothetical protein
MTLQIKPAIAVLLLFLTACLPRPSVDQIETVQPVLQPATATASATATMAVASSPTASPTKALTRVPNMHIRLELPVPQPLTGNSPWLMFPCSALKDNHAPTISNGDGTGCVPATLPSVIPEDREWITVSGLRSAYLAFRDTIAPSNAETQEAAYRLLQNGLDDKIWIVKLPENRIIRAITQIDPDGWARIDQMWKDPQTKSAGKGIYVPLPLAIILNTGAYSWSPNGRFLVYTGIDKVGVDLFVYDSLTDTIRRMTRGRQGAFFWSWSPDSKWIVYHEMDDCLFENGRCLPQQGQNYYAVTFPAPEYQFEYSFPAGSVDWISNNRYILEDSTPQGQQHTHLVEVNLEFGTVAQLYNNPFLAYTYVPNTYTTKEEMYLLNMSESPANNRVTGIYQLTPRTGELKPFHTGKYADYIAQWDPLLERFILSKEVEIRSSANLDVRLAPIQMVFVIPVGILGSDIFDVSPDGLWFTTQLPTGSRGLFTERGKQVQDLGVDFPGQDSPVTWMKKSEGFYFFASTQSCSSPIGCVYSFTKKDAWTPKLIGEMKAKPNVLQVIDP